LILWLRCLSKVDLKRIVVSWTEHLMETVGFMLVSGGDRCFGGLREDKPYLMGTSHN